MERAHNGVGFDTRSRPGDPSISDEHVDDESQPYEQRNERAQSRKIAAERAHDRERVDTLHPRRKRRPRAANAHARRSAFEDEFALEYHRLSFRTCEL